MECKNVDDESSATGCSYAYFVDVSAAYLRFLPGFINAMIYGAIPWCSIGPSEYEGLSAGLGGWADAEHESRFSMIQ